MALHPNLKKRKLEGEYWTLNKKLIDHEKKIIKYFRINRYQFDIFLYPLTISFSLSISLGKEKKCLMSERFRCAVHTARQTLSDTYRHEPCRQNILSANAGRARSVSDRVSTVVSR